MCDGTVALCHRLEDTKAFGRGYAKARVCCHVAMAPGGARRWWRGGRTWHATHTPWPCNTGKKGLSGRSTLGRCIIRQILGSVVEAIYWLSVQHTCAHTCNIQTHTQTWRNTTRGENEISNSSKTTSHRWTHFGKIMQRITRLYIKHTSYIKIQQHLWSPGKKAETNTEWRQDCSHDKQQVCVGVQVCSDHLLTILVHGMRFRLLLANISEGAHNRYTVGQFLVVLVVMLFEQGLTDLLPGILTYRAWHLMLIQNHVWFKTHTQERKNKRGFSPHYSLKSSF